MLVIDETGMIGNKQMHRFVEEVKKQGAKLVLVGDPEQLQPINAGKPFKEMVDQINVVELTEIRRQKVDWQRQASVDLAQKRTQEDINLYAVHDNVHYSDENSDAISKLVNDYMNNCNKNPQSSRLALAHHRINVHSINQAIRTQRKENGELQNGQLFKTYHGPRSFAAGDQILFTRNDRELGVKNGLLGTIMSVSENKLTILLDQDGDHLYKKITTSPKAYPYLEHG